MKNHTKIYLKFFNRDTSDFICCEVEGCSNRAVDINHIIARGAGGNPSGEKDSIFNLMAMCRKHHIEMGDRKQFKEEMFDTHIDLMLKMQPKKTLAELNSIQEGHVLFNVINQSLERINEAR